MTVDQMVVDVADGLQMGVTDGGSEEFEAAPFHIATDGVR